MSNVFKYPIFMTYFDISKIDELFKKKSLLTNIDKPSFISFYREDYHNKSVKCLDDAVRNTLKNKYDYIPLLVESIDNFTKDWEEENDKLDRAS